MHKILFKSISCKIELIKIQKSAKINQLLSYIYVVDFQKNIA